MLGVCGIDTSVSGWFSKTCSFGSESRLLGFTKNAEVQFRLNIEMMQ